MISVSMIGPVLSCPQCIKDAITSTKNMHLLTYYTGSDLPFTTPDDQVSCVQLVNINLY